MVRYGRDQPPAYPPGCTPLAAICLDTHEGHFMGRGRNRLLVYELDGQAYLRAAGTWDDMPVTLEQAYRSAGRKAQQAFWGDERPESSMLHQIARRTAAPMSDARYDAIVIGAGPNGLTAAVTLARAGRSVLVVEGSPTLGGAAQTAELTLPGFQHDVFSAVHPAGIASPVFARARARAPRPALDPAGDRDGPPAARRARRRAGAGPRPHGALARRARRRRRAALAGARRARTCSTSRRSGRRCWPAFPRSPAGACCPRSSSTARWSSSACCSCRRRALAGEILHGDGAAWLYGSSLHGDAPLDGAGQRDRRRLAEHPRPRGRLAEPAGRRGRDHRGAGEPACTSTAARRASTRRPCACSRRAGGSRASSSPTATSSRRAPSSRRRRRTASSRSPPTRSATPTCAARCASATGRRR